ncbi:hypothetical protein ACLOJK_040079 [Asimina triloba]
MNPETTRNMKSPAGTSMGLKSTNAGDATAKKTTVAVQDSPERRRRTEPMVAADRNLTMWWELSAENAIILLGAGKRSVLFGMVGVKGPGLSEAENRDDRIYKRRKGTRMRCTRCDGARHCYLRVIAREKRRFIRGRKKDDDSGIT